LSQLPKTLAGIQIGKAISMLGGNESLYLELVHIFITENETMVESLNRAIASGDLKKAERLVHSLKGEAGSIGAVTLYDQASELEQSIVEGCFENKQITSIDNTLTDVINALKELAPGKHSSGFVEEKQASEPDHRAINCLFIKLRTSLTDNNFSALKEFAELKKMLPNPEVKDHIAKIDTLINAFSFAEAQRELKKLNKKINLTALEDSND